MDGAGIFWCLCHAEGWARLARVMRRVRFLNGGRIQAHRAAEEISIQHVIPIIHPQEAQQEAHSPQHQGTRMLRRTALQCGAQVCVARCGAAVPSSRRLLHACANHRSSLLVPASSMLPHSAPYQRPYRRAFAAAASSAPHPSPPQLDEDNKPKQDEEATTAAAPEPPAPLFSCPAPVRVVRHPPPDAIPTHARPHTLHSASSACSPGPA